MPCAAVGLLFYIHAEENFLYFQLEDIEPLAFLPIVRNFSKIPVTLLWVYTLNFYSLSLSTGLISISFKPSEKISFLIQWFVFMLRGLVITNEIDLTTFAEKLLQSLVCLCGSTFAGLKYLPQFLLLDKNYLFP